MHGFATIKAAFAAEAPRAMGDAVVPLTPIVFAAVTNYAWYNIKGAVLQLSEYLVIAGHLLAFSTAAWAAYVTWKANRAGKASHMDTAKAAGTAAAAASKANPYVLILTALTLGGYLIYSALTSKGAHAAPLAIAAAPAAAGRKRKADDDAGGEDTEAAEVPDGAPKWMVSAYELLGVSEKTARGGSNPVISAMFEYTQLAGSKVDARRVPWCAAFVNAMLERNGYAGTKSAMARSFLKWGVALEAPRPGCVVVIWRGEYDNGENGHVFFYTREDRNFIYGVGGNQGDAVSEARFHKSKVLGYRWPRSAAKSKTNVGLAVTGAATTGAIGVNVAGEMLPAPEASSKTAETAAKASEVLEKAQEPLQQAASALHGTKAGKYIVIALSVLAIAGVALAWYGRKRIREEHGI